MGQPHKHAELIKAWADGAEIQVKGGGHFTDDPIWMDIEHPSWRDGIDYRIKPKTIKYRNFLWSPQLSFIPNKKVVCVCSKQEHEEYPRDRWVGFVKWLGDWQEAEVE